ncbi:MAG: FtsW/RodA/SpoVE family cell cycle protein [Clostridia bacterium]|nr:FtsW/RodA/SpoVE family cell cycle protein [Clostridia bacterium]
MKRRENSFLSSLRGLDFILIAAVLLLTVYGLVCVSTATAYHNTNRNVIVQLFAAVLGITAMIVISLIDYDALLQKTWLIIFFAGLALLFLPLIQSIPQMIRGNFGSNRNWITLPLLNVDFQPSEIVKLTFIVSFGYLLGKLKDDTNNIKSVGMILLFAGSTIGFVLLEKDLGAAVVFVIIFISMWFAAKMSLWYLLGGAVLGGIAAPFLWSSLDNYQKMRILVGFDPYLDPSNYGYQVLQTIRAMQNGGVTGMGYGKGTLTHATLKSVFPARETDMILGVIGEEFGFIGIMIYVILISVVIFRVLRTAQSARHEYGGYICIGVAALLIFQTVENIGMCLGTLPVIGLTLPFMSYGGSSMVSLYMCIGVVMSVRTHRQKYYFERESI